MGAIELYVLRAGFLKLDLSSFTSLANIGTKISAPVPMYLVKTPDGNILFDTGLCGFGMEKPEDVWGVRAQVVVMEPEDDVRNGLAELDLSPRDIRYVVQSHLHWDHCGGSQFFPDSTIVLQRTEYRHAFSPAPYEWRYLDSHLAPVRGFDFLLLDGDAELVPGVSVVSTPGHTPGHQSLVVETGSPGPVVLAGDAVPTMENVEKGILPGILDDAAAAWHSMRRLTYLARHGQLFPSHDPEFFNAVEKSPRQVGEAAG